MRLTSLANILSFFFLSPFFAAQRVMRQSNQTMGVKPRALANGRVTYHGGPVLSNVEVVTIFWGGKKKIGIAEQLNTFYDAVTKSGYMDWLSEYNTPTQVIGRGELLASYSYDHAPTGTVSRRKLERLLKNLISTGRVPPPTVNTYYAIHFAPKYYVSGGLCDTCVSSSTIKRTIDPIHIHYGVVPAPTTDNSFEAVTLLASYLLLATVTNPEAYSADSWYDPNGGTITNICFYVLNDPIGQVVGGDGVTYTVAKGYSNENSACITSTPTPN